MAESSSPDITPKEEPVTLDRPESPNPFLHAIQGVSDFISKCCLKEAFTKAPNQYKEYLGEFWYTKKVLPDSKILVSTPTKEVIGEIGGKTGGLDQISNKDATILYCLANGVQMDYAKIIWEDLIHKLNKKTREKIFPYPMFISLLLEYMAPKYDNKELTINPTQVFSVHNWILKLNQPEEPPFTDHMKAICNLDVPVDSKALKYSSPTEESQKKEPKQAKVIAEAKVASMKAKTSYLDINQLTELLVAELKNIQWELPAEFLALPHLASLVQEKLKTLDSLPCLLKTITNTLNRFGTLVENASGATTTGVPSADKATASPAEGENNKVYKAGKRLLYTKRKKAISLGKGASKVSREVHSLFLKGLYLDFQDSPDYEEDTKSSHEYLNDLEEEYQARALLIKSKRFYKKELSSDDNQMVEVKVLTALAEENDAVNKGARNGEWVKISMRKCDIKKPIVFNTRRQQTKETYHITFDESLEAIKFLKPLVDNINIAESERYLPNEYLHSYEPSQSTKLCKQFAKRMTQIYEMSMMGVFTYFLEFQIKQSARGISINQEKYVKDLLKEYDINGSSVKTPMVPPNNLEPDLNGKSVNETQYKGIIGSLMYLTASRPDIQFATSLCGRYHENPKESHLIAVKRIFRYLKGYNGEIGAKGTLKKSCLSPRWRLLMGQIIQCLGGKTGGLNQISNKDATILYCLANGVQIDYAKIIWEDLIYKLNKKTKEKIVPYPRFISLLLEHMAPKYDNEELKINPTQAICNLDVPVDFKAPKYSSPTEKVPQAKQPGARSGLKRKKPLKHTSESITEASKSQSGHSKKKIKSSSAIDTSPSHPSPPTLVVGEIHKEAQQAAGNPTSLEDTSKDGAHPQINSGYDASADFTAKANLGISAPKDSIP
nr:uncharacterized mitochondrial protein AtMg00810-like [Tanacetum cinerariifolium]